MAYTISTWVRRAKSNGRLERTSDDLAEKGDGGSKSRDPNVSLVPFQSFRDRVHPDDFLALELACHSLQQGLTCIRTRQWALRVVRPSK
jgi:hypothetical protein